MSSSKKKKTSGMTLSTDMFAVTDPDKKSRQTTVYNISANKLVHFKNHPFKLYENERFADMVESIKANGIMVPIIARPLGDEIYEILSGHNRVEAGKAAGLESVPVIIHEDLDDEEALLIVTETNLIQRSFADLSHSEKAAALDVHYNAIKSQGKRNDLINSINELLNADKIMDNETLPLLGAKLRSDEKIGLKYGLSKNSVARYLRVNKLSKDLKALVDNEEIPVYAAVEISYLSRKEQCDLYNILNNNPAAKLDIKKAQLLREHSADNHSSPNLISDVLSGAAVKKRNRASLPVQSFKIKGKILSKYFKPEQKPEEIEAELIEALEFYRAHKK